MCDTQLVVICYCSIRKRAWTRQEHSHCHLGGQATHPAKPAGAANFRQLHLSLETSALSTHPEHTDWDPQWGEGAAELAPEKPPSCRPTLCCLLSFLSWATPGAPCSPLLPLQGGQPTATELTHRNLRPEQPLWKINWVHFKNKQKTLKIKTFYEIGVCTCSNEQIVLNYWMQILSIAPEFQRRSVSIREASATSRPAQACSAFCKLVLMGSSAGQEERSPGKAARKICHCSCLT